MIDARKDIEEVLHPESFLYVREMMRTELISGYHDDSQAGHFGIYNSRELIPRLNYSLSPRVDIETNLKAYDICQVSKAVCHKLYGNAQLLLVLTDQ